MPLQNPTEFLGRVPVVPVLTIERVIDAVPLARALVAGGLPVLEVTLRTPDALEAVRAIVADVPEAVVGVGTVVQEPEIRLALAAGARFLVSPGTPPALAAALARAPVLPGCATVSEAMALAGLGFAVQKFFPAEAAGGTGFLNAVASPLPHIAFCPTGGIDQRNMNAYLALPNVVSVGGSWVAPRDAIARGDFGRITVLAQEAVALAGRDRP
jgi:2-dehydro-3-deoxyphosphogluconate aldolase / (4S)-4-hydroxy-2-oxoglutarate aldolase